MNNEYYIGLMSGTSVDSLDAALVEFTQETINVVGTHTLPVSDTIRKLVHQLALPGDDEISQLRYIDKEIAQLSHKVVGQLCQQANLPSSAIKAIGSHGQTIRHYPQNSTMNGYSLQAGDPNIIAEKTGITTIADFRRRDIAAGGQGAPLAPAFHNAIFHSSNNNRIILNTGGIANITWLPKQGDVIGYDTGPANGLMDSWCQLHQHTPYDKNGTWAASGNTHQPLLNLLLSHTYLSLPPPKSTGREDFNLPWLQQQIQEIGSSLRPEDVQATLLSFTVETIAQQIEKQDHIDKADIYICGGGAQNTALMQALSQRLHPRKVTSTEALGIHPDWVEAVAFAWLAKQTLHRVSGNLPSVTGANKEVILGGIYLA